MLSLIRILTDYDRPLWPIIESALRFNVWYLLSYTGRRVTHSPHSASDGDGRLETVATALHEMMSRQLIHRKDGFHRLGVWP